MPLFGAFPGGTSFLIELAPQLQLPHSQRHLEPTLHGRKCRLAGLDGYVVLQSTDDWPAMFPLLSSSSLPFLSRVIESRKLVSMFHYQTPGMLEGCTTHQRIFNKARFSCGHGLSENLDPSIGHQLHQMDQHQQKGQIEVFIINSS